MKVKAIGVATHKTAAAKNWQRGMRHTGITSELVGLGQPYSFDMKIKLALEAMKADPDVDIFHYRFINKNIIYIGSNKNIYIRVGFHSL